MNQETNKLNIPHASGIDTLYYFAESGADYNKFYQELLRKIDRVKMEYEYYEISYTESDILIPINDIELKYSGKGRDGFHWFKHDFLRVGFKDSEKNKNVNDICVQLNAVGIYTLGLKSLIEYINKQLLKDIVLNGAKFPITRIDVNMFIEHNFSYLTKEMVVSKKKNHSIIYSEKANSKEVETYYIGKSPFRLRIYNKLQELKTARENKRELMYNHFGINGIDYKDTVWNVEFELHREFLKRYGIDTIEQALQRSNELFKLGCELVRFVDLESIKAEQIHTKNRRLADTLLIWDYIKESYDNQEFLQLTTPLEKVEKISYRYTLEDAKKPIARAVKRLMIGSSPPTLKFFLQVVQEVKQEVALKNGMEHIKQDKEDLSAYSDEGLLRYQESLEIAMQNEEVGSTDHNELLIIYQDVLVELEARELLVIPF